MAFGIKDKVLLGASGTTLAFEAPEGRPSADGTVTLYDTRYSRTDTAKNPIVAGTATRRAISTTTTGAAGAAQTDPKRVPMVPPAALKMGDYLRIVNAALQTERRKVTAISAAYIEVDGNLVYDYATGATVASAEMTSPAVPDAFAADEANLVEDLEAVWVYTVDGVTYTRTTHWDLVREAASAVVPDSALFERFPDLRRFTFKSDPGTFQFFVRAAERDVENLLALKGYDVDRLRGGERYSWLVEVRAHCLIAENAVKPNGQEAQTYIEARKGDWDRIWVGIQGGTMKIPYDQDEDGVIQDGDRKAAVIRLTR